MMHGQKNIKLYWVKIQKIEDLIYTAREAWNLTS